MHEFLCETNHHHHVDNRQLQENGPHTSSSVKKNENYNDNFEEKNFNINQF